MQHNMSMPQPMSMHQMMIIQLKHRFWLALALTLPVLALSPMIQHFMGVNWHFEGDNYLLLALSSIIYFYCGWPFLSGALTELKHKSPAMMTLIALAITIAYVYSAATVFGLKGTDFFWELATLILIMLLGHWLEMKSVMGASNAVQGLMALMPDTAHMLDKRGTVKDVATDTLKKGDLILIKPGEKIPADGVVANGESEVNESMLTGESVPVLKKKEDTVIAGAVNGDGVIQVSVSHSSDQNFLSQVVKLVQEAELSKSKTQRLVDIAARWLFYIALIAGILTFVLWYLLNRDLAFAIERAVTVMVIACPHALGLAAPLVTAVSTALAAKNGLLIKNRTAFENARNIDTMVFDKTGTLTQGAFGVTEIKTDGISEPDLLALAYAVENNSEHPIAKGITAAAQAQNIALKKSTRFKNLPGQGLEATIDSQKIMITSPAYLQKNKISYDTAYDKQLSREGKTIVYVLRNSKLIGSIALADIIRKTAKPTITELKQMHVTPYLLTGDNAQAANFVAAKLHIDHVFAEVLPQDKVKQISELQTAQKKVAMTGDGVNDAPALAEADLGIAIGAGTDIAIESADVILVKSNPQDVISVLKLSRATYQKMVQNLIWATGYNLVAIPLAAGILFPWGIMISPALGALLMSLSTIIVAINAKMLKIK